MDYRKGGTFKGSLLIKRKALPQDVSRNTREKKTGLVGLVKEIITKKAGSLRWIAFTRRSRVI